MNMTLAGYKSYLVGAGLVVVAGLHSMGYINDAVRDAAVAVLGGGGVMALRAAISKAGAARK